MIKGEGLEEETVRQKNLPQKAPTGGEEDAEEIWPHWMFHK
jgi:hypothetical protein